MQISEHSICMNGEAELEGYQILVGQSSEQWHVGFGVKWMQLPGQLCNLCVLLEIQN